jgi:undecaprenyl-diphosphatase
MARAAHEPSPAPPARTRPLVRRELTLLLALAFVAACLYVFVELAGDVRAGSSLAFDRELLIAMRTTGDLSDPIGPGWVEEMARDFTALGSLGVIALVSAAVVGYLLIVRLRRSAALVVAAIGGGTLVSTLLKNGFHRARPDLVPHAMQVYTHSFPSGHAMLSAVTYLTLGAMLVRLQPHRRAKVYVMCVALALTLLVGVSRVYLGVHWPSDVLAGWCVGACWAVLCWAVMLWLQRRGEVDPGARVVREVAATDARAAAAESSGDADRRGPTGAARRLTSR